MESAEAAIEKELIHVDCGSKIAGCQAQTGGTTEAVSVLRGRNVSALGTGKQARERYPGAECEGVSVSVLQVQTNVSPLSGREYEGRPNREIEAVCGAAVADGLEPSSGQLDPEWAAGDDQFYDNLARCAGGSAETAEGQALEAGSCGWSRWGQCVGLGR